MGVMKELKAQRNGDIWHIGGKDTSPNPYIGARVEVTWLKKWGNREPGFTATGILQSTFAKYGHTLIGELLIDTPQGKRTLSCPWSRNWLKVEIM